VKNEEILFFAVYKREKNTKNNGPSVVMPYSSLLLFPKVQEQAIIPIFEGSENSKYLV